MLTVQDLVKARLYDSEDAAIQDTLRHLISDEDELAFFGQLPRSLHSGEASCLAIAHHRGWTLLTDDQAARTKALELGIRVSGTLGCLVLATVRRHCTEDQANDYLRDVIEQGYRSPVADLATLL